MPVKKTTTKKTKEEKPAGEIVHFYGNIGVGVIEVYRGQEIKVGDTLKYKGNTTNFEEKLTSMQEYGKQVETAKGKKQVGVKLKEKVRQGDKVYKVL